MQRFIAWMNYFFVYYFVKREIDKLASLCAEKGANEEEIAHCRVKRE